jgi:hypothetical protein
MTFGAATAGEVLVDRYRLEQHVDTDTAGRQIWRGVDAVLRRPVALVVRQPGGEAAAGMLTSAVAASRIVHPHLVSVYDAIDEGNRAYLVREWVPGVALRDVLRQGPLDAERATLVTHAVAEAVAALHSAGIVHGNIHPGTILIADDGRVVLLDAHADAPADPEFDVRAVGAVLYAALTGHWPYAEAGRSTLPDAPRDPSRRPARPRQVRGGIPRHLDEIATELLDPQVAPPDAGALAAEFARLAATGQEEYGPVGGGYDDPVAVGPMGFRGDGGGPGRRVGAGKIVGGVALLAVIAAVGIFVVLKVLPGEPSATPSPGPVASTSATTPPPPVLVALTADQIRVVDPPGGDRTQTQGIQNVVDGDPDTGWRTSGYATAPFGNLKPGMGILVDLGSPTKIAEVRVQLSPGGGAIALRKGTSDPGDTSEGDDAINDTYTNLAAPAEDSGTRVVFTVADSEAPVQFLLLWISELPLDPSTTGNFPYRITINEIEVLTTA